MDDDSEMTENDFKEILTRWKTSSFEQIQEDCHTLRNKLEDLQGATIFSDGFQCDNISWQFLESYDKGFQVIVIGDGNCLPRSESVFAFGNEHNPCEIRVRIIIELCLHMELYLDNNYLKIGER